MTAHAIKATPVGWLIAEFCPHPLFNGWHLYLRDTNRLQRNSDGSWGWMRSDGHLRQLAHAALAGIGIAMRPGGDGSCDDDGYAELARRFPIRGSRRRGGLLVVRDATGGWTLTRSARNGGARHVAMMERDAASSPGHGGDPGSGQPGTRATQQGAATPGQGDCPAAGNVAEPQLGPTPDRTDHPPDLETSRGRAARRDR